MSNIDTKHNVRPYTSGVTKAFTGQRLATVTYKTDKVSGIKPDSVCVSVPMINQQDVITNQNYFLKHMITLCERTQDGIIRDAHEAGKIDISDDEISIDSVIAYLEAESTGGRMTKVAATQWFDNVLADSIAVALASKLGISEVPTKEESDKIDMLLSDFRNSIGALTAGNTSYDNGTCLQLKKALSFAPEDDVIAEKFNNRLDTMMKKVPKSLMDSL